jgi:hypothetical protein
MFLRTKLRGKTYEFPDICGFDTPFAMATGYSTTEVKMILSSFFSFYSFAFFAPSR